MPGTKPIKSENWAWFKAELDRLLGADAAAALFAELTRRRRRESEAKQRQRAPFKITELKSLRAERAAAGLSTKRVDAQLERLRALMGSADDATEER